MARYGETDMLVGGLRPVDLSTDVNVWSSAVRLLSRHYQAHGCSVHLWNRGGYTDLEIGRRQLIVPVKLDWTSREDYPFKYIWIARVLEYNSRTDPYWNPKPEFIHFVNRRQTHFIRINGRLKTRWRERNSPANGKLYYVLNTKFVDFWPLTGGYIKFDRRDYGKRRRLQEHSPETETENKETENE